MSEGKTLNKLLADFHAQATELCTAASSAYDSVYARNQQLALELSDAQDRVKFLETEVQRLEHQLLQPR